MPGTVVLREEHGTYTPVCRWPGCGWEGTTTSDTSIKSEDRAGTEARDHAETHR